MTGLIILGFSNHLNSKDFIFKQQTNKQVLANLEKSGAGSPGPPSWKIAVSKGTWTGNDATVYNRLLPSLMSLWCLSLCCHWFGQLLLLQRRQMENEMMLIFLSLPQGCRRNIMKPTSYQLLHSAIVHSRPHQDLMFAAPPPPQPPPSTHCHPIRPITNTSSSKKPSPLCPHHCFSLTPWIIGYHGLINPIGLGPLC